MSEETFIHTPNGELVSKFQIPGTKVKRKNNLPYSVHSHFPLGEVKLITESCGRMNLHQDPNRPYAHVFVEADTTRGVIGAYCFHPYTDTLEVVDED